MRKIFSLSAFIVAFIPGILVIGRHADAKTAAEIVAGRVITTSEPHDALWYVHPTLKTRSQITDWESIVAITGKSGQRVSVSAFDKIDSGTNSRAFSKTLPLRMSGRMLLDVTTGERWYVFPGDHKRYAVKTVDDAKRIFALFRLGISQKTSEKIPSDGALSADNMKLRERLSGRVLWRVSDNTHWYVSPKDLTRYQVDTDEQIMDVLTRQLTGITHKNIVRIPHQGEALNADAKTAKAYKGRFLQPAFAPDEWWYVSPATLRRTKVTPRNFQSLLMADRTMITPTGISSIGLTGEADYTDTNAATALGTFRVKVLTSNLALPGVHILTLGADDKTCFDLCTTQNVGAFASTHEVAVAALNGTYFCPASSSSCEFKADSYYSPLFHSSVRVMLNDDQLPVSDYAMLVFDADDTPYYFRPASQFGSLEEFQTKNGVPVRAAISNWPALIENGVNILNPDILDSGQRNTKTTRVAIGVKGKTLSLLVVYQATVVDLAAVAEAYGLDYAINLDGGSSTALWRYGSYLVGPGRDVPNAIIVQREFGV